jgi:hypothetical protein
MNTRQNPDPDPYVFVVTEGWKGRIAAGPYATYDAAVTARSGLSRPWRMTWRRRRYVVQPDWAAYNRGEKTSSADHEGDEPS